MEKHAYPFSLANPFATSFTSWEEEIFSKNRIAHQRFRAWFVNPAEHSSRYNSILLARQVPDSPSFLIKLLSEWFYISFFDKFCSEMFFVKKEKRGYCGHDWTCDT